MINKESIVAVSSKAMSKGANIKVRDICYLLLERYFEDKTIPYRAIFGSSDSDKEINDYVNSRDLKTLRSCMIEDAMFGLKSSVQTTMKSKEITFEENRDALIELLDKIKQQSEDGEIDKKDAIKLETDIRTKLNDKFSVSEESKQQFVIVEAKFNHICEWTRKECFLQTKEYAKKQWKLYERDELMRELEQEFDLTPKK